MLNDTLLIIVFFAGGMMVALDDMPAWIAALGRLLPLTHTPITAARSILLNGHGLTVGGDGGLVWMVTLAAGWLTFGAVAFHRAGRKGRWASPLIVEGSVMRLGRHPSSATDPEGRQP